MKREFRPNQKLENLKDSEVILACLCCEKHWIFEEDSNEAKGVFNVFCDGECEDKFAAAL